jgi:hypothetical protein
MGIRTVLKRIERAEEALKAQSIFSQDCICFPEKEQPFFCSAFEEPVAAQVKCLLHGDRFKRPQFFIYIAAWRRAPEPACRQHLSAQYRKAWEATSECGLPLRKKRQKMGKKSGRVTEGVPL